MNVTKYKNINVLLQIKVIIVNNKILKVRFIHFEIINNGLKKSNLSSDLFFLLIINYIIKNHMRSFFILLLFFIKVLFMAL